MKYLFFLIILLVPIGSAFAEVGENFDTEELSSGLTQWTSHYERVFDGTSWQNYILTDNANEIKFDSAGISFSFDKANCDFKLYDPITNDLVINSYQSGIAIDGIPQPNSICNIADFKQLGDMISFTVDHGDFKTSYDLSPSEGMEWTQEIINTEGKASTFTITETCKDCTPKSIEGNKIDFGSYTLDTKNEEHNTVKSTLESKGDYLIEYEKVLDDKEKLIIDPTFSSNNPTIDGTVQDTSNNDVCNIGSLVYGTAFLDVVTYSLATVNLDCARGYFEYDITSIPDGATIVDVDFIYENTVAYPPLRNCDYVSMGATLGSDTPANIFTAISGGTVMVNNDSTCTVAGTSKRVDFGSAGNSLVQSRLVANSFTFGVKLDNETLGFATKGFTMIPEEGAGTPPPTLTVFYSFNQTNAVTDLIATDIRGAGVDLSWTTPSHTGIISGYQINSTTPWNHNVGTIIVNNTLTGSTTAIISSLTGSTQYSFRVGVWTDYINASGNVLNITTDFDPVASFTPGSFDITQSGTDDRNIFYSRTDINSTALWLNVTATNTIELNCNFYYKFAMTNNTFTNIANVSVSATRDMASFKFLSVDNEIIDVLCWDQYDNLTNSKYLITQTHFPLQDQIENFRNGTFGTHGQFGSFDMITIFVIIISMIGFNRINEVVGVVLSGITVGIMAWFGLIQWYTILSTGIAIVIFWAWSTHKSD